jgi:GcrA cell cycle regulator
MSWTEERTALLRKLWAEGLSASQAAKQLGGVTRNAVIGKVHRLGLASKSNGRPRINRPRPRLVVPCARNMAVTRVRRIPVVRHKVKISPTDPAAIAAAEILAGAHEAERRRKAFIETTRLGR